MIRTEILPCAVDPILRSAHDAIARQDFTAGLQAVLPFLQKPPLDPAYLDVAVTCYWHLGDTTTSLALLQVLVTLAPDDRVVWGKLGTMLLAMGKNDGAAAAFEQCVELAPRSVKALAALNMIKRFDKNSHRTRLLREAARSKRTTSNERAIAWNACGKIEETAGDYRQAFRSFGRSNAAEPAAYNAASFEKLVEDQINRFEPRLTADADGPTCIFIVGLPRSGTTLVDKILSRHPLVRSTGEGMQLQSILANIRQQTTNAHGPWDWATRINDEDLRRARQAYLRRIAVPSDKDVPFIVNKLPLGVFDMGFAQQLLPGARFIFMSRHPLDVGLSNYCTHFHDTHAFSKSLESIAHMTRQVYRSVDDYIPKLGGDLRVQSYRNLVTDPETQIRALLKHVGLPWDPACLTPEQDVDAVRTASIMQVREGINKKGLNKWHRYRDDLLPLEDHLGADWLANWETRDQALA